MQPRIPFTVIGGYLGSGKTTLLNALLHQPHGMRLAVLVNDFGSINIDAELIENQDGETISLTNGCICCTISDSLGTTLWQLQERTVLPDQVVVEASGVAYPAKVARYGDMPGFTLQGIIVVVDAETICAKSRDKYVGHTVTHQLKDADLLILNKIDLVTGQQKEQVRAWLAEMAPQARIIETQYGRVPHGLLLGIESSHEFKDEADDHPHGTEFTSWSYESGAPFQRQAFERFAAALPEAALRAKGVLYLLGEPDRRFIYQMMGSRWKLIPGQSWGDEKRQSRIVWIGLKEQLEQHDIAAALESCAHPGSEE